MIQQQTKLKVADNSGAKTVKCIKVTNGFNKKFALLSDLIVISVIKLRNKARMTSKVQKVEVYKAMIIRTKKSITKKDGMTTMFNTNAVSLLNKQNKPIASRILGPVPKKIKKKKIKIGTLSTGFVV